MDNPKLSSFLEQLLIYCLEEVKTMCIFWVQRAHSNILLVILTYSQTHWCIGWKIFTPLNRSPSMFLNTRYYSRLFLCKHSIPDKDNNLNSSKPGISHFTLKTITTKFFYIVQIVALIFIDTFTMLYALLCRSLPQLLL